MYIPLRYSRHCLRNDVYIVSFFGEITIAYVVITAFIYSIFVSVIDSTSKSLIIRPFPQNVISPQDVCAPNLFDVSTVRSHYLGC